MNYLAEIRAGCSTVRYAEIARTIVRLSGESVQSVLDYIRLRTGKGIDREDYDRIVRFIPSSSSRKVPGVKSEPDTTPMMPRWDRPRVSV
jgi:hypothetical protein